MTTVVILLKDEGLTVGSVLILVVFDIRYKDTVEVGELAKVTPYCQLAWWLLTTRMLAISFVFTAVLTASFRVVKELKLVLLRLDNITVRLRIRVFKVFFKVRSLVRRILR